MFPHTLHQEIRCPSITKLLSGDRGIVVGVTINGEMVIKSNTNYETKKIIMMVEKYTDKVYKC